MNVIGENGEDISLIDEIPQEEHYKGNLVDMFKGLTENEIKIINLYQENSNISQSEIAKIVGITQSGVSHLLKGLQKKYVK